MVSYTSKSHQKLTIDPFSDTELDTGRLPKIVDDWLIEQINKGKDTDEIRAMLSISEEAKEEVSFITLAVLRQRELTIVCEKIIGRSIHCRPELTPSDRFSDEDKVPGYL